MDLEIIATQIISSGTVAGLIALWLKTRLEASIKAEADRSIRSLEEQQRRYNSLLSQRQSAYQILSKLLINLRRYCSASGNELQPSSEFAPRTNSLHPEERHSLLEHWGIIERASEEFELFFTDEIQESLRSLHESMSFGFHLEQALVSGDHDSDELNGASLYGVIEAKCSLAIAALHEGLELPESDPSR